MNNQIILAYFQIITAPCKCHDDVESLRRALNKYRKDKGITTPLFHDANYKKACEMRTEYEKSKPAVGVPVFAM